MPSTQMNLRIDAQIKEQGDAALEQAGYSPTQAVRTIWEYAALHAHDPQAVRSLLQQAEAEGVSERNARRAAVRSALRRCDDLRTQLAAIAGVPGEQESCDVSDKELRGDALFARWEERGLL